MSLATDVQNFLEEREKLFDPAGGPNAGGGLGLSKISSTTPKTQIDDSGWFRDAAGGTINFLGDTLWSAVDTGLIGIPGLIAEKTDLFDAPEVESQWAAGIGSLLGFINPYGIPLKLGGVAARVAAKPFIHKAGRETIRGAGRAFTKRIGEMSGSGIISKTAAGYAKKEMQPMIRQMSEFARWNAKTGTNWNKFAVANIDDAVRLGVKRGLIKSQQEAKLIADAFKKNVVGKGRPMSDFIDLAVKKGWAKDPHKAIALGSMLHEAIMFSAIDAVREGVDAYAFDRKYEKTAPLWGAVTGAGFGALKFLKPAGKASSTYGDWKQGMAGIFGIGGKHVNAYENMTRKQLTGMSAYLGDEIERSGIKKLSTTIRGGENARSAYGRTLDKSVSINLKDPELDLRSLGEPGKKFLVEELNAIRGVYGRELIKKSTWEELGGMWANKGRMVAGSAVMNLHTIFGLAQGHDMDMDEVLPHILIGAFINRKGTPKSQDFNVRQMGRLRRQLQILGFKANNHIDYTLFPADFRPSRWESINPLKDPVFKELNDMTVKMNLVSEEYSKTDYVTNDGSMSVNLAKKMGRGDYALFQEYYNWLAGASGHKYIKPFSMITAKEAQAVIDKIKTIEYTKGKPGEQETVKLDKPENFREALTDIIETNTGVLKDKVLGTLHRVAEVAFGNNYRINSSKDQTIGHFPDYIRIKQGKDTVGERIENNGKEGNADIEWVRNPQTNELLKGQDAVDFIRDTIDKTNNLLKFGREIGRTQTVTGKHKVLEIESVEQLLNIHSAITGSESMINKSLGNWMPGTKFDYLTKLEDMSGDMIQVDFKRKIDYISKTLDKTNDNWNGILNEMVDLGIVTAKTPGKNELINSTMDQIEIVTKPGQEQMAGTYKAFIQNFINILGAKGKPNTELGSDRTSGTGKKKIKISVDKIDGFKEYLDKIGIPTRIDMFNDFSTHISNRILTERVKGTGLTGGHIDFMMRMMTDFELPLVRYGAKGAAKGFEISLLADYVGKDSDGMIQGMIEKYNVEVKALHESGKKAEGKDSFIEIAEEKIALHDRSSIEAISLAVNQSKGRMGQWHNEVLLDFINVLDGLPVTGPTAEWNTKLSANIAALINKHGANDTAVKGRLVSWLMGNGVIKPKAEKKAKGLIEYEYFPDKLSENSRLYKKLERKMEVEFNTTMKELDGLVKQAYNEFEQDVKRNQHSTSTESNITRQEFFTKYFPNINNKKEAFGSKIESELQDDVIKKAIYGEDVNPDKRTDNPFVALIEKTDMMVKVGPKKWISAKEIWKKSNTTYTAEARDLRADMVKIFKSYQQGKARNVISVSEQGLESTKKQHYYGTKFDKVFDELGMNFNFIDGRVEFYDERGGKIGKRAQNVFELDSEYIDSGNKFAKRERLEEIKTRIFDPLLEAHYTSGEAEGFSGKGFAVITFGNGKNRIVVDKGDYLKVAENWKKKIYDKYINDPEISGEGKRQLESLKNQLFQKDGKPVEMWQDAAHEIALQNMVFESMITGSNTKMFAKSLDYNGNQMADLAKRMSLFFTPKFSRLLTEDLSRIPLFNEAEISVMNHYTKGARQNKVGVAVWNDVDFEGLKQRMKNIGVDWDAHMGTRGDKTSYDSISFISKRFMDLLNISEGGGNKTRTTFKPVITSNGESVLMLGKTVFVYSPHMQKKVFSKSDNLDIVMTRSADKLDVAPKTIDMSMTNLLEIGSKRLNDHIFDIGLDAIGVRGYEKDSFAKQSYSMFNFMNSGEAGALVRDMYMDRLSNARDIMTKIADNPFYANAAVRQLKKLGHDFTIADLAGSDAGKSLGSLLEWVAITPEARASVFGEGMLHNMLKTKFIDPIISPEAVTNDGKTFGFKSVISKDPLYNDLDVTTLHVDNVGRGEIVLPDRARNGSINFTESGMDVRLVNKKTGKIKVAKDIIFDILKKENPTMKDADAEAVWLGMENLGNLHDYVKRKAEFKDWDVGVMTTRYPRNRPNDLAILRLRDFLTKDHGNQVIINDLDVYSIFEGDYDVDKADYFWAGHRSAFNHVARMKERWVNNVDPTKHDPSPPGMKMIGESLTGTSQAWRTHDANQRVLEGATGMAQKTLRIVENVSQLGSEIKGEGQFEGKRALIDTGKERIVMDMSPENAKLWYSRFALESQLIIDHSKGVHHDILTNIATWRNDFLFPDYNNSITADALIPGDPNKSRIRLFRKYVKANGQWVESKENLNSMEKDHIRLLMDNYSKFAQLTTNVYSSGNEGKTPAYSDMIDYSKDYFGFFRQTDAYGKTTSHMGNSSFKSLVGKYGYKDNQHYNQFKDWYAGEGNDWSRRLYKKHVWQVGKGKEKKYSLNEAIHDSKMGELHYIMSKQNPWAQGTIDNGKNLQKGSHGSVAERVFNKLWRDDPFRTRYGNEFVLTGDRLSEFENMESMILGADKFEKWDIEQIMPKMISDVSTSVKIIKNLKRTIVKIDKSHYLSETVKAKRKKDLNEVIAEKEAEIEGLLSAEYKKTHKGEDLPKINLVDIQTNADVREGTIQLWNLEHLRHGGDLKPNNRDGYDSRLNQLRKFVGGSFNQNNVLGQTTEHGGRSLHNANARSQLKTPLDYKNIEKHIIRELDRGYEDYGMAFILDFMKPKTKDGSNLDLGVYNGRILPIAIKPTTNYKRGIKWMLDYKKRNATNFDSMLRVLAKRDAAYSNFFSGKFRYMPTNDAELMNHLQNIPNIPKMIKSFGANYTDLSFKKDILNRHVFGMGKEYDNTISFYRQLIESFYGEHPDKAAAIGAVEGYTKGISYLSQITVENGYSNPLSKMVLMDNLKRELHTRGIPEAISKGIDINGQPIMLPVDVQMNPLMATLHGGSQSEGVNLNPMKMLSHYKMGQLRQFINQSREVVTTPETNSWKEKKEDSFNKCGVR